MYKEKPFLLFDLGGVLVELVGAAIFLKWLDSRISIGEFGNLWLHSQAVRLYESGKLSQKEFAHLVISEFGFNVGEEEFLNALYYFIKGPYDGIPDLLTDLGKDYDIGLLSNTNESHWERVCREFKLDELLPLTLLSYKTGLMKPDREAFIHAVETIGRTPSEIVYFDDNPINVREARAVGLEAYCITGDHLRDKIRELGLLP